MKKALSLITILITSITTLAQEKKPDVVDLNLKGNVKAITEVTYDAKEKFGDPVKEKKTEKIYYEFNKAGYRVEFSSTNYKYNWKLASITKYDNNNNIIEERSEDDGEVLVSKIKYDANGEPQETNVYDKKGKLLAKEKITPAPPADTSLVLDFNSIFSTKNIYNGEGELERKILFNEFMSMEENKKTGKSKTEYLEFDDRSNLTKKKIYDNDSAITTYKYNARNQKIQMSYKLNKLKPTITNYEYDTYGNVIKETDSYGREKIFTYTYDKQNNWTNRLLRETSYGDVTYEITEREIKYY